MPTTYDPDPAYGGLTYGSGPYGSGAFYDPVGQGIETTRTNQSLVPLPPPVFTGLKLKEDVRIGDFKLNSVDENNVIWICTNIDGWWNLPEPDMPDIQRGFRDGSYDARGRWQARNITIEGAFYPPGPEYVSAARNSLIEAINLVYGGAWFRTLENPTRTAWVRLSGQPSIATENARGRTIFSIGLRAADPIKYAWNDDDDEGYYLATIPCKNTATAETGEETITNVGNTSVAPFFEIEGPVTAPATIYNEATDELMTIVEPLRGSSTYSVLYKKVLDGVATITTPGTHNFAIDDLVTVTEVDELLDGEHLITDIPSASSFSYNVDASDIAEILVPYGTYFDGATGLVFGDTQTTKRNIELPDITGSNINKIEITARVNITRVTDYRMLYSRGGSIIIWMAYAGVAPRVEWRDGTGTGRDSNYMGSAFSAVAGMRWYRFTVDASGVDTVVTIQTAADSPTEPTSWTTHSTATVAGVTGLVQQASGPGLYQPQIGQWIGQTWNFYGTVSRLIDRRDGNVVVDANFAAQPVGTTSFVESSVLQQTLTLNASGTYGTATIPNDVLEVDVYEREVALNGIVAGARTMIDTLTDWVTLAPGANVVRFEDEGDSTSDAELRVYYKSGWIG